MSYLLTPYDYYAVPLRASVVTVGPPDGAENYVEVVSLDAMKDFLKESLTQTANDNRIKSLIVSARKYFELYTRRSITKKRYLMSLSRFPNIYWDKSDKINLWHPPLTGEVSIKYIDLDGIERNMISGRDFQVDYAGEPGRIAPLASTQVACWPPTQFRVLNAVRIFYVAGYEPNSTLRLESDAIATNVEEPETEEVGSIPAESQVTTWEIDRTVPADLVNGIMQLVLHWYQNRDAVIAVPGAGGIYNILPLHVQEILDAFKFGNDLTSTVTPEF
jgi:hypothetical protein